MEYPIIHETPEGFKVQTSAGAYLPGIYMNLIMAEKAIQRYQAKTQNLKRRNQRKRNSKSEG